MDTSPPISNDIFTAFLKCKHKAYLKLTGMAGEKGDYEKLQLRLADEHRRNAAAGFLHTVVTSEKVDRPPSLPDAIQQGHAIIMDANAVASDLSSRIDALERVGDTQCAGRYEYSPVLFMHYEKVTRDDKLLLAFQSIVLGSIQGAEPTKGKIIHGSQPTTLRVHLGPLLDVARAVVKEIEEVRDTSVVPPQLVLNQHCGMCEFRKRCRDTALLSPR